MAALRQPKEQSIHQLKVTLKDSRPPIWRRIQVDSDISLARLHRVLQVVMGWEDYHLHQFKVRGISYGVPDREFGLDIRSDRGVKLSQVAPNVKDRFVYEYDFGDSWEHQIVVEKILPPEPGGRYPICLTGKRAGPPEDCGGVWGYDTLLETIRDPNHPEHDAMLEWLGRPFDPEAFDLHATNETLKSIR